MPTAVFLDRDGVLNRPVVREGKPYPPASLEEFELYPEVLEACRRLKEAGLVLVVATNQPDVGRGTQRREVVEAMHAQLRAALPIDRIEVCYDAGGPGASSEFRKPKAGNVAAGGAGNVHRPGPEFHGRRPLAGHRLRARGRMRDRFHRPRLRGKTPGAAPFSSW